MLVGGNDASIPRGPEIEDLLLALFCDISSDFDRLLFDSPSPSESFSRFSALPLAGLKFAEFGDALPSFSANPGQGLGQDKEFDQNYFKV